MKYRLILLILAFASTAGQAQQSFHKTLLLMGSRFDITVVAKDEAQGNLWIQDAINEITRIEKLISSWDPDSQTTLINSNAGIMPVVVDRELFELIERSIKLAVLTDGAFDITYASMDRVWKFDGSMNSMPDSEIVKASILKVGYKNLVLDPSSNSIFLKNIGMKIGFGAIGKGYAADRAKAILEEKGVKSGIINAAGDLNAWGKQSNGKDWQVAITNPLNKSKAFAWLPINDSSIVTSGDYEKHVTFDGRRYAHIINPKTGYPSMGIVSVSVMAPKAELADALATSIFVMGVDVGIDFINQLPNIECVIVDINNKVITSKGIKLNDEG